MTPKVTIDVGKQFSLRPFGRYPEDGPDNGERFRKEILSPQLKSGNYVEVEIDSLKRNPSSSWLEEAFGGLVRKDDFAVEFLRSHLKIVTQKKDYDEEIWSYITKADHERK